MKPSWLFDDEWLNDPNVPRLIKIVEEQGMEAQVLEWNIDPRAVYDFHACVVFYGSITSTKFIGKRCSWVPGVFCDFPAYDCTSYYPVLGKYLLNSNYTMIPYGEVKRCKDSLYDNFGLSDTIFIRPNRSDKPFSGQTIYVREFDKYIDDLGFSGLKPSDLCVVSTLNDGIECEWRFVAVDGEIITGSQYLGRFDFGEYKASYKEAEKLAQEIARLYQPDRAWTIDICSTYPGEFKLLEINSFSSAGLYECDLEAVVQEVSRVAQCEWNSVN